MSRTITRWISGTCLLLLFLTDGQCCSQKNQRLRSSFKLNQTFGRFDLGTAFSLSLSREIMQSSNILIRPQRLFLAAVASRLRVSVICLDRFLSEGNFLVSFQFFSFWISNTRRLRRGINDVVHVFFFFSSRSNRSDNAYSFLPLRWPFFSFKADRWKS